MTLTIKRTDRPGGPGFFSERYANGDRSVGVHGLGVFVALGWRERYRPDPGLLDGRPTMREHRPKGQQ